MAWAALLAAAGCTSDQSHRDTRDDPLLGNRRPAAEQPLRRCDRYAEL